MIQESLTPIEFYGSLAIINAFASDAEAQPAFAQAVAELARLELQTSALPQSNRQLALAPRQSLKFLAKPAGPAATVASVRRHKLNQFSVGDLVRPLGPATTLRRALGFPPLALWDHLDHALLLGRREVTCIDHLPKQLPRDTSLGSVLRCARYRARNLHECLAEFLHSVGAFFLLRRRRADSHLMIPNCWIGAALSIMTMVFTSSAFTRPAFSCTTQLILYKPSSLSDSSMSAAACLILTGSKRPGVSTYAMCFFPPAAAPRLSHHPMYVCMAPKARNLWRIRLPWATAIAKHES